MKMTKPDTTTVERFHMEAQAEFGQDAWPVWKPHSGGAWVQFQDHQNALRALATERDAALARAEQAEVELARVINIAAGLFAGGFDNNVALIRAAMREGGDNG
jgi:hypothetical protein